MIVPVEIRNQQFSKGFRGYQENEVRQFMVQLAEDFEKLYSENARLKDQVEKLEYELDKYRKMEAVMNNSLILAQQTAEDIKQNARKEANMMIAESRRRIADIFLVYQEVIKRLYYFNSELKSQIAGQMDMIEKNEKKIEDMAEFFYSRDLKEIMEKLDQISGEEI
ncbi:MAG: DivIVA domain-containing protein [Syntrophomonadaceae bacterium]